MKSFENEKKQLYESNKKYVIFPVNYFYFDFFKSKTVFEFESYASYSSNAKWVFIR